MRLLTALLTTVFGMAVLLAVQVWQAWWMIRRDF
jgi:hypothetical protein